MPLYARLNSRYSGLTLAFDSSFAVPPTLVFNLLRGFDVAALVSAPVLLNADPIWSLAIGVVVLVILRTGFNLEEMSEQAKEQQKLLDAEKAARAR